MALVALITWWSCNAFIPVVASGLAQVAAAARGLDRAAMLALVRGVEGDGGRPTSTGAGSSARC